MRGGPDSKATCHGHSLPTKVKANVYPKHYIQVPISAPPPVMVALSQSGKKVKVATVPNAARVRQGAIPAKPVHVAQKVVAQPQPHTQTGELVYIAVS
jgi:hypothetical protein